MASEAIRGRAPAGGAIGFRPTGRSAGRALGKLLDRATGATPPARLGPVAPLPARFPGPVVTSGATRAAGGRVRPGAVRLRSDGARPSAQEPGGARPAGGHRGTTALVEPAFSGERHGPDVTVIAVVLALTALGILMVYSSSAMKDYANGDSTFETVGPQLLYAAVGVVGMVVMMLVPYRRLRLVALPGLVVAAVLLGLLFTSWRQSVGGSTQWLRIPGLPTLQPGEFVKLALVVYLASWMQRRGTAVRSVTAGFIPFGILVAPFVLGIFVTPDVGSALVVAACAVLMYFVAGGSLIGLGGLATLGGLAAAGATMFLRGYQMDRLSGFADPFVSAANAADKGYQAAQGLLSIGLGGLFGAGLGDRAAAGGISLPEAHNDYIYAVIGQEFGFIGASLVILGFIVLAWRGVRIARHAPNTFGALLAAGVTAWLCVQAFINIGVVVALLPVTGITLPFVSAGGSSLIVSLVAVGILLSVSRETVHVGGWVDASGDRGRRHRRAHLPRPRRRPIALRAPGRA